MNYTPEKLIELKRFCILVIACASIAIICGFIALEKYPISAFMMVIFNAVLLGVHIEKLRKYYKP